MGCVGGGGVVCKGGEVVELRVECFFIFPLGKRTKARKRRLVAGARHGRMPFARRRTRACCRAVRLRFLRDTDRLMADVAGAV